MTIIGFFHDSLLRFMYYFNILGGMRGLIYNMFFNAEAKISVLSWASKMDLDQYSTFKRKFKPWYIHVYKQIRCIIVFHTHCNIKLTVCQIVVLSKMKITIFMRTFPIAETVHVIIRNISKRKDKVRIQ